MTTSALPVIAALVKPFVEHPPHRARYAWLVLPSRRPPSRSAAPSAVARQATRTDQGSRIVLRFFAIPAVLFVVFSPRIAPWRSDPAAHRSGGSRTGDLLGRGGVAGLGQGDARPVLHLYRADQQRSASHNRRPIPVRPASFFIPACCCSGSASARCGATGSGWQS